MMASIVSIPQAVRGCMQLCVPEPLWDKPSKWGFGQETSFSIVFAIFEHVRLLFFQKGIGSNPSPSRVSGTHVQIGQVFVSRRSFLAFAHNLPTYIFYPNLSAFSIPFIKNRREAFAFPRQSIFCQKAKKGDCRRKTILLETVPFCNREIFCQIVKPLSCM